MKIRGGVQKNQGGQCVRDSSADSGSFPSPQPPALGHAFQSQTNEVKPSVRLHSTCSPESSTPQEEGQRKYRTASGRAVQTKLHHHCAVTAYSVRRPPSLCLPWRMSHHLAPEPGSVLSTSKSREPQFRRGGTRWASLRRPRRSRCIQPGQGQGCHHHGGATAASASAADAGTTGVSSSWARRRRRNTWDARRRKQEEVAPPAAAIASR